MSLQWGPDPIDWKGTTLSQLITYVGNQFRKLSSQLKLMEVDHVLMTTLHVEPTKPREGMVVTADGSDWNPGSGAGIYQYRGGSWVKIG